MYLLFIYFLKWYFNFEPTAISDGATAFKYTATLYTPGTTTSFFLPIFNYYYLLKNKNIYEYPLKHINLSILYIYNKFYYHSKYLL